MNNLNKMVCSCALAPIIFGAKAQLRTNITHLSKYHENREELH